MTVVAEVDSLCWPRQDPLVYERLRFVVECPGVCGMIGPSGCGKSSILKALIQWKLKFKSVARVESDGDCVDASSITLLPQDSGTLLLPWYTGRQNLELADSLSSDRGSTNMPLGLARAVGLNETDLGELPANLSGGQRRRLALCMALLRAERVLFLDEPFTGLDIDLRVKVWDIVRGSARGTRNELLHSQLEAIFLVSHGIEDIAAVCDRVYILDYETGRGVYVRSVHNRPPEIEGALPSSLYGASHTNRALIHWQNELRRAVSRVFEVHSCDTDTLEPKSRVLISQ